MMEKKSPLWFWGNKGKRHLGGVGVGGILHLLEGYSSCGTWGICDS